MNWFSSRSTSEESQQGNTSRATPNEDEIRRKRLARFEALAKESTCSNVAPSEQQTTSRSKQPSSRADTTTPSFTTKSPTTRSVTDIATTQGNQQQSVEQQQEQVICRILKVTLNEPTESEDVVFMKDLKEEWQLEQGNSQVLVTTDRADRILFERLLQMGSGLEPLQYLIDCYQRASDQESLWSVYSHAKVKHSLLDTVTFVKKLIVSYLVLVLSNAELCYTDSPMYRSAHMMEALVEEKLPAGLLKDLVARLEEEEEEDTRAKVFHPIMELVCSKAMKTSLVKGNFAAALRALGTLVSLKPLAVLFTRHRNFNICEERISQPTVTGRNVGCFYFKVICTEYV